MDFDDDDDDDQQSFVGGFIRASRSTEVFLSTYLNLKS